MKQFKLKQLIASLLLGAMMVCGTSAFAVGSKVGDGPSPDIKDIITEDTVFHSHMPSGWDKKCSTSKNRTKVKNVKVGWFTIDTQNEDAAYLHVEWTAKKQAKSYEIQISRGQSFGASEYIFSKTNRCTLPSACSYVFKPNLTKDRTGRTYYVRVRALYKKGNPGPWSNAVRLRVTSTNQMSDKEINALLKS